MDLTSDIFFGFSSLFNVFKGTFSRTTINLQSFPVVFALMALRLVVGVDAAVKITCKNLEYNLKYFLKCSM
jgi:hypothetical protein